MSEHPVAALLRAAAVGAFPVADGGWTRVAPWAPGVEAVVAFTGHAVLAVGGDVTDGRLESLGADGFGGAHDPRLVTALAGTSGWVDVLDAVLVTRGLGANKQMGQADSPTRTRLVERPDLADHPRATYARTVRADVRVVGESEGDDVVVTLGRGIGGLPEVGLELSGAVRGGGHAAAILEQVRLLVPTGEVLVAAVAPGNARALRAFLGAGFVPVGSVQLWRPERD